MREWVGYVVSILLLVLPALAQRDHWLELLRLHLLSCRFESSPTPKHAQYYLDKKNHYIRIVHLTGYGASPQLTPLKAMDCAFSRKVHHA
jgi:hypothetical protein